MIETIELAAGVTLLAVQTEKFKSGCFSFNLMRPHTKAAAPLDALLPSVLLRGSERWPDMRAISMRLDELYGATLGTLVRLRGETKLTGFYADFIEEAFLPQGEAVFAPMVEFFRDILFHPALENGLLNARYVESEKQNLIHAIESAQNDKRVYAAMRMRRIMCEGEAASIPRLGYAEDVAAITPEALTAHWRTVLRTAPIMLFYAGRRTPQEAAALFRPLFDGLERDPVSPPPTVVRRSAETVREVTESMDVTQGKLVIGMRTGITASDPDYPALVLLNSVYGSGVTSKLFVNVREKRSLCYYASSAVEKFKGLMIVSSGISFDQYETARDAILAERDACRRGEITPEEANRLGCELAKRFTKGNHAYIVCTHIDKSHIHNHVIWNSTALNQTRKFRNFWGSSRAVRRLNDTICIENGYSIVENPKRHGKSYNKWLGDKKKPSHRERICAAIDDALTQKPDSFETLLELLRQAGYEVKGKKVPSLLGGEQKKSIRMDTLGDGYTPADLRAVIAGEKAHTPRKNAAAPVKPEKRSGNLLVDIQAKLRAGKGAGYARWATLFNLKQMAQTVAYLQDHELLDYAVLSEKAAAASAYFNELSARIKAAEKRMAEIAVLREHIVGYAKTRDTYVAYRKAGYSKKFLAEHESEITIHKAAKNYFDGLGFKKLPTIKALNTEYAELLAEKKAAYADYRKAREEMKELLTAKANIDRILELDKEQEEANERREKEAEQR